MNGMMNPKISSFVNINFCQSHVTDNGEVVPTLKKRDSKWHSKQSKKHELMSASIIPTI